MKLPRQVKLEQDDTHRLIPLRYTVEGRPILDLLAQGDDDFLNELTELEGATNDRLLGENGKLPGISAIELVSGFPLAHIVNASFTHSNPTGTRFSAPGRGAWYAGFEAKTSQTEVAFHRSAELAEIGWMEEEVSTYVDYLADFRHEFHDVRHDLDSSAFLNPDSYRESQALGMALLNGGSAGIVYPSVRYQPGTCLVCFRPPLVLNVRKGRMTTITFVNTNVTSIID